MAMKIYTKTGDKGETSLFSGTRRSKADVRIEAYGTCDELNSFIGMLRDQQGTPGDVSAVLLEVQDRIFTLGSHLANDGARKDVKLPAVLEDDVEGLERAIDQMEQELEPMRSFILPGGHPLVSLSHVCRTVCRRAERRVVELQAVEPVDDILIRYLNRLSDYLFVLSRYLSKVTGAGEIPWVPRY
jgi:cob(I)alamin adenosyltransferase